VCDNCAFTVFAGCWNPQRHSISLSANKLTISITLLHTPPPGEIDTNNDIIATKMALQFNVELGKRLTEELPFVCACTFLTEEEQRILDERYENCLAEEELNPAEAVAALNAAAMNKNITNSTIFSVGSNSTTNSSASLFAVGNSSDSPTANPSRRPTSPPINFRSKCIKPPDLESFAIEQTIQELFANRFSCGGNISLGGPQLNVTLCSSKHINETTSQFPKTMTVSPEDMFTSLNNCGKTADAIVDAYRMTDIIVSELISSDVTFNWIRCSASFGVKDFVTELLNPFQNTTQFRPAVQTEYVMEEWAASQEELYCQYLVDELALLIDGTSELTGNSLIEARLGALIHSIAEADGFDNCVVNSWAGGWFW